MNGLTAFQRDILYAIAGQDEPHGLAIKEELDTYSESEINHGRLSPNLDTLVEKGLINEGCIDDRPNSYTLTTQARQAIRERRMWENERLSGEMSGRKVLIE